MGRIFPQTRTRGSVMTSPPQLVTMTPVALQKEIGNADQVIPTTIVFAYGESSFELVAGPLYKAYDEDGAVSWWVGDRLVGTARDDASPIVPSPALVFARVGWVYPLGTLMVGMAA